MKPAENSGNGFKDTDIGPMPVEWEVMPLKDAATFTRKPRGLTPSDYKAIPFIPMNLVPDNDTPIEQYELRPGNSIRSGTYCEKGDILLAKITPSFENGKQGIVGGLPLEFAYATTEVYPIKARPDCLDQMFLFHLLRLPYVRADITAKMEGSTGRQRIPKAVIENYPIPLPPLPEQRRIAHVLSTIQRAIAAQEDVIAAAKEMKRSLMQRLFTYGPGAEPAPTKETEIGEIPAHWTVHTLGELADISGSTPSRKNPEYWANGTIPWVKTGEVDYCTICHTEEMVTAKALEETPIRLYPPGTLLLAMYGQGITRGKVALLGIEAATNQACAAVVPRHSVILQSPFLFFYLTHSYHALRNISHGTQQLNLGSRLIASYSTPVPPTGEQEQIVWILQAADRKISAQEQRKAALQGLFQSMLEQLMTGRVRVHASGYSMDESVELMATSADNRLSETYRRDNDQKT